MEVYGETVEGLCPAVQSSVFNWILPTRFPLALPISITTIFGLRLFGETLEQVKRKHSEVPRSVCMLACLCLYICLKDSKRVSKNC